VLFRTRSLPARPPLPPDYLLDGMGPGDYWAIGEHTVALIARLAGLRGRDHVLDVGCGLGRIAWPLAARLGRRGRYVGVDAARPYVEWCHSHLPLLAPKFTFVFADVRTTAYNVHGAIAPERFVFPWPERSFDLAIATSLFTHLLPAAADNYLAQIARCLRPGGRLFSSFFLLDEPGRAAAASGATYPTFSHPIPEGLLHDPAVPEDGIAFHPEWVAGAFARHGLRIVAAHRGSWKVPTDLYYQDLIVAQKPRWRRRALANADLERLAAQGARP
jgi:SAM-dependent methyltransferase